MSSWPTPPPHPPKLHIQPFPLLLEPLVVTPKGTTGVGYGLGEGAGWDAVGEGNIVLSVLIYEDSNGFKNIGGGR